MPLKSVLETSKLVLTKTLLLKHYYRLQGIPRNSESCSENGLFTPRALFFKIGVVPRFLKNWSDVHN